MKILNALILLLFAMQAQAGMYKCENPDGSISYTDQPCAKGSELKLPPIQTYSLPPLPASDGPATPARPVGYRLLAIQRPAQNETLRNIGGVVTVVMDLQPALNKRHKFAAVFDGREININTRATSFQLTDVQRGTHTLQVRILDRNNSVLMSSPSVIFHVHQTTQFETSQQGENGVPVQPQRAPMAPGALRAPRGPSGLRR